MVDGAYLTPIFQSGGVKYMDGFAMHTYVAPFNPEDGYQTKGHPFLKNVSVKNTKRNAVMHAEDSRN